MSTPTSTKPYMVRAMHEWCMDNGFTPYLAVAVDAQTRVPAGYVKDGEIVLNINYSATKDLLIGNEAITFSARFNGESREIYVPMAAVRGIFARESGQGLFFEVEAEPSAATSETLTDEAVAAEETEPEKPPKKPTLHLVK